MPGFRAGEKIEIRPGEARMEEIKDLEQKVDPFVHPTVPTSTRAGYFYDPVLNAALREFMTIGERSGVPEIKVKDGLEKYESYKTKTYPALFKGEAEAPIPRAEIRKSGVMETVVNFLRKLGGFFGGGFGGPMMIFGFLLHEGKEAAFETELTLALAANFQNSARGQGAGKFRPVYVKTNDKAWIRDQGGLRRLDVVNTPLYEQPGDVRGKSPFYQTAQAAMQEVFKANRNEIPLDAAFIDAAGKALFKKLLPDAKQTFEELPYKNKDYYRKSVEAAVRLYFDRGLESYNRALKNFDAASNLKQDGKPLEPAQEALLKDPALMDANAERAQLVEEKSAYYHSITSKTLGTSFEAAQRLRISNLSEREAASESEEYRQFFLGKNFVFHEFGKFYRNNNIIGLLKWPAHLKEYKMIMESLRGNSLEIYFDILARLPKNHPQWKLAHQLARNSSILQRAQTDPEFGHQLQRVLSLQLDDPGEMEATRKALEFLSPKEDPYR